MHKKLNRIPRTTFEIYQEAIAEIGMTVLNKIYSGIKARKCPHCKKPITDDRSRTIYSWGSDPDICETARKNPIDRNLVMTREFMKRGQNENALAIADLFAAEVKHRLVPVNVTPDCKTIQEELLDNLPALAKYQDAITSDKPRPEIRACLMELINELEQDMALLDQQEPPRSE